MPKSLYDFLRHAKREVIVAASEDPFNDNQNPAIIKVTTDTGCYSFPDDPETWDSFDRDRRSLERRTSNVLRYGDHGGRANVWRDNETCKHLAILKSRPHWCRVIRLAYNLAQDAPEDIRKWAFKNLLILAQNAHHDDFFYEMTPLLAVSDVSHYLASVMPVAWGNDTAYDHFFANVRLSEALAPLQPSGHILEKGTHLYFQTKYSWESSPQKIVDYAYARPDKGRTDRHETLYTLSYAVGHLGLLIITPDRVRNKKTQVK